MSARVAAMQFALLATAACAGLPVGHQAPAGPASFVAVSAGQAHSCALTSAGAVYCWGRDSTGEIGDGASASTSLPARVRAQMTFASVSAGRNHTCAVSNVGEALCWGSNRFRQLGIGSQNDFYSAAAIPVSGGQTFATVTAAGGHTCALTPGGTGYCWGFDGYDAFGHQGGESSTPVDVENGPPFKSLTAGGAHTCGLSLTGTAFCWGFNDSRQLGYATPNAYRSITPRAVAAALSFVSLTAGNDYTCGVEVAGAAYCWGANGHGELGNGTRNLSVAPTAVVGHLAFAVISAGPNFYAGAGATTPVNGSALVPGSHTCGVTMAGAAYCWGDNSAGQLGNGTHNISDVPVAVSGGLVFKTITAGALHTCGVTVAGAVFCWGSNHYGQLGDGTTVDHATPVLVRNP